MKNTYRILRTFIVSLLSLAVGIPLLLYVLLWLSPVRNSLRLLAEEQLSLLTDAEVSIGSVEIEPFTRLKFGHLAMVCNGDTVLTASDLNAGVSGRNLLRGRIVITDVELMHPNVRISRQTPDAPLNIQPIIEKLKGDGSNKSTKFELSVQAVVIRFGSASYDVISEPQRSGIDPNHLAIDDLRADLTAPRIGSNGIAVNLKRLTFNERSGIALRNLAADVRFVDNQLSVNNLIVALTNTELHFAPIDIDLAGERIGEIELLNGSVIALSDVNIPIPEVAIDTRVELFRDSLSIKQLNVAVPNAAMRLAMRADATETMAVSPDLTVGFSAPEIGDIINNLRPLPDNVRDLLAQLGTVSFEGNASWRKPSDVAVAGVLLCDAGKVDVDASLVNERLSGTVASPLFDLGAVLPNNDLSTAEFTATFSLGKSNGEAVVAVDRFGWKGYDYCNIGANVEYVGKEYRAFVAVADSVASLAADAFVDMTPGAYKADLHTEIERLLPSMFGVLPQYDGYNLSGRIDAEFVGEDMFAPTGKLEINDLTFVDAQGNGLQERPIVLTSDFTSETPSVSLRSDLIDVDLLGQIDFRSLVPTVRTLLADALPQYFRAEPLAEDASNEFTLTATVYDDAPLFDFVSLPVVPLYPIVINGTMSNNDAVATVALSAPYLQKKNSLISGTSVKAELGERSSVQVTTVMPSKFGDMHLEFSGELIDALATATFEFANIGDRAYNGSIGLAVRPLVGGADIRILESKLTLDNEPWGIEPTYIGLRGNSAIINGLDILRPGQELSIRGVVSANPEDRLDVKLDNINLDYIFSALQLAPTIQFGGQASGSVSGSALFSGEPILQTNDLFVRDFSYGHCVMGDANILAHWNNETRGIELHANVAGHIADGSTVVDGVIYPLSEELDFRFNARHSPMGFLHTFMSVWASKVGGYASGNCHLFGNFKDVDLEGDFMAENFALTVAFTNVTYFATDSVHIRPGVIELDNIEVRDVSGHTARLGGRLTHRFFKQPRFVFRITEIDRLLALDTKPSADDDRWYGTVRASNGAVILTGEPEHVNISANVSTAPESNFAFVLTNAASATEYSFLTFHDATPIDVTVEELLPGSPELDKTMKNRVAKSVVESIGTTTIDIDLQVDVTTDANMTLVMDPTSGDKITGSGTGHLGLHYGSGNDELKLYGEYKIESGSYNFSLQDIILKNFLLSDGSTVSFQGDPMDARLDISAVYQVNANLSDLDESFLNDKEVQRTNVPVNAVLNVNGLLQDPQISFDLDFPTMSSDVKRKVSSIVSTDEMMNRQIIYLLALNRFYTPEYMTTTKGSELMSVASGTISSQLSNILGQLSDKISVAPSLRSDAGDFSDVEFDVALSSTLLNNRLLLNGNLGYRDKSLNNNQFIGDFDIEYLLTRRGNWRIKAYNHFNDRTLYVKNALTTQGIGLVFKHDFDTLLKWRK